MNRNPSEWREGMSTHRIQAGYTKLPPYTACYDTTCGHSVGGRLEVCKRSELAATRKPKLGDMASGELICFHLLRDETP